MKSKYVERARRVAQMAWRLVKNFSFSMSEAMKSAWAMVKMRDRMNFDVVEFVYNKVNGEERVARGTLSHEIVPQTKGERSAPKDCFVYYDNDKEGWRSFKINNFVRVSA